MNYDTWNPYEDNDCIEAYIEHIEDWYNEWCEENEVEAKVWASKTHYIEDHKDGFEEFAYNYFEDMAGVAAERDWESSNDK